MGWGLGLGLELGWLEKALEEGPAAAPDVLGGLSW